MSAADDEPTLNVIHKGTKHKVAVGATIGQLRNATAAETGLPAESISFLVKGKKVGPDVSDDTPLSEFKIQRGATVMLSLARTASPAAPASTPSAKLHVEPNIVRVRAVESDVDRLNEGLGAIKSRVDKLALGFVEKDKTPAAAERIRKDCRALEESLMRAMLSVDELGSDAAGDKDATAAARWRAERKCLVQKTQQILRGCDDTQRRLDEIVADEYDEMKHRRGKDS